MDIHRHIICISVTWFIIGFIAAIIWLVNSSEKPTPVHRKESFIVELIVFIVIMFGGLYSLVKIIEEITEEEEQ